MLYKGQTITIALDTDSDLSGYTGYILYEKPNGTSGTWTGSVTGDTITYDIGSDDIDVAGVWKVQAKAVNGDDVKYGQVTVIEFRSSL